MLNPIGRLVPMQLTKCTRAGAAIQRARARLATQTSMLHLWTNVSAATEPRHKSHRRNINFGQTSLFSNMDMTTPVADPVVYVIDLCRPL